MSNGSGGEYSIQFSPGGVFIRGFDHESELSPWSFDPVVVAPGLLDDVPAAFREFVFDPSFAIGGVPCVSLCLWRQPHKASWSVGWPEAPELEDASDGSEWMFDELDGRPDGYVTYMQRNNLETTVDAGDVRHVLAHRELDRNLIARLSPGAASDNVLAKAQRFIGYPDRG